MYIYKDYLMEASSQLRDTTFYQKCQSAPLQGVIRKLNTF